MKQTKILNHNFNLYSEKLNELNILEENQIKYFNKILSIEKKIPTLRTNAFPNGTNDDKENFKKLLEENNVIKKELKNTQDEIVKIKKTLSAIRYHNFQINQFNILNEDNKTIAFIFYIEEKNIFEITLYTNSENKNETIEVKPSLLKEFLILNSNFNVFYSKTKDKNKILYENIPELKIDNSEHKNISIQHLIRHYTDFKMIPIIEIKDLFKINTEENNSKLLKRLYLNIIGEK